MRTFITIVLALVVISNIIGLSDADEPLVAVIEFLMAVAAILAIIFVWLI